MQNIGDAMLDVNGKPNQNALKIRITDAYLDTLSQIYDKVKIVGIPGGSQAGGNSNPLSAENIATAMVMFKQVNSGSGGSDPSGPELQNMQAQISAMMKGLNNLSQNVQSG